MYAKVINPKTNGKKVYNNKGTSQRCTNYLAKEAKEAGTEAEFFGAVAAGVLTTAEVIALIDSNVKGLAKETDKFHSLVLSPTAEELAVMGNNTKDLETYTRAVMDLYAKNFTLKNGRELGEPDLVWAAIIHQDRKNRGTDEGIQGEKKEGLQTHIHVIVSARDAEQKITLNSLGMADRFNRVEFKAQAMTQLEVQFGRVGSSNIHQPTPERKALVAEKVVEITILAAASRKEKKPLTVEQVAAKDARLDVQVARLNSKLPANGQLDPDKVKEAAKERKYDNIFYDRLGQIERSAEKGNHTASPYQYLSTGRVVPVTGLREYGSVGKQNDKTPTYNPQPETSRIQPGIGGSLQQSVNKLLQGLKPAGRAQDVRSEVEQQRDQEMER